MRCRGGEPRAEEGAPRKGRRGKGRPPQRGLQHLFERARRYHAMLESGEARSLEAIGRAKGVTGRRIAQIVALLQLAPGIIEAVDVPVEELPAGEEQVAAWEGLVGGSVGRVAK